VRAIASLPVADGLKRNKRHSHGDHHRCVAGFYRQTVQATPGTEADAAGQWSVGRSVRHSRGSGPDRVGPGDDEPWGLLAITALWVTVWASCGSGGGSGGGNGGNPGTPAGTYNITVTASGGNIQQTTTFRLTVQ
jgi:hypothetical protein